MDVNVLAILIFFLIAFLVMVLVRFCVYQSGVEKGVSRDLRELEERIEGFVPRVQAIEKHSTDYMNTLGPDGAEQLSEMREIVRMLRRLTDEVGALVAASDFESLQEARLLLDGAHPGQHEEKTSFDGSIERAMPLLDSDWESKLEEVLQSLGADLSEASIAAKNVGIPKRRKSQSTIAHLFKVGIRLKNVRYDW